MREHILSAVHPIADSTRTSFHVRNVPIRDFMQRSKWHCYSITSSLIVSTFGGIVRRSAKAVF